MSKQDTIPPFYFVVFDQTLKLDTDECDKLEKTMLVIREYTIKKLVYEILAFST